MDEKSNVDNVVDTTDCLEAIGAFKAMKNLFFVITFVCLIAVQSVFWLNYFGYADSANVCSNSKCQVKCAVKCADNVETTVFSVVVTTDSNPDEKLVVVEPETEVEVEVEPVTIEEHAQKAVSDVSNEAKDLDATVAVAPVVVAPADAGTDVDTGDIDVPVSSLAKFAPQYHHICAAVSLCNFIIIISATIYCLILLMSIKISLIGRLGGISHISRAFFLSMFALVILLPWQNLFDGFAYGAIYSPCELFTKWTLTDDSTIVCKVMYFARFSGMWALSLLLLLSAQIRSAKWSKTTLRRLGIIR